MFGSWHLAHWTPNVEKLPAPHSSHLVCALFGDLPAGHATHCVAPVVLTSVIRPLSHCEHSLAPVPAYWPTAHVLHSSTCSGVLRYFPGAHAEGRYFLVSSMVFTHKQHTQIDSSNTYRHIHNLGRSASHVLCSVRCAHQGNTGIGSSTHAHRLSTVDKARKTKSPQCRHATS